MMLRPWITCLALIWLGGCQWLPQTPPDSVARDTPGPQAQSGEQECYAEIPDFSSQSCLLHDWIGFSLASQRGDREWRDNMLMRLQAPGSTSRLARAVVLSWGGEGQWNQASELFKADLHKAPPELQPLLRYWLNDVERRRAMYQRLQTAQGEREALASKSEALEEKLEALTDIERNINSRQ